MASADRKLADVFNAYAEKVVEARELETLFRGAVESTFTKEELKAFESLPSPQGLPDTDSGGIYVSDRAVYFSGAYLKRNTPEDRIPEALRGKIAAAFDAAFRGAKDHADLVKTGEIIPPPPFSGFGF